jgi:hypothetical protein
MKGSLIAVALASIVAAPPVVAAPAPSAQAHFKATAVTRLGKTIRLGNLRITPVAVVEDSRCPRLVTCVWRGRLRITVAVAGHGTLTLDNGVPVSVAKGRLTLVEGTPLSQRGERIPNGAYRFKLRYER